MQDGISFCISLVFFQYFIRYHTDTTCLCDEMLVTTQQKDQNHGSVTQLRPSGAHKHFKVGQTDQSEAGPDDNKS